MRRKMQRRLLEVLLGVTLTVGSVQIVFVSTQTAGDQINDPRGGSGTGGLTIVATPTPGDQINDPRGGSGTGGLSVYP